MNKDCLVLFEKMSEYIDGELDPELVDFAEKHLEECIDCGENIELMLKTLGIFKKTFSEKIPNSLQQQLRDAILKEQAL